MYSLPDPIQASFVIVAVCLTAFLIGAVFLYYQLSRANQRLNKEYQEYRENNEGAAKKALEEATLKAKEIIHGTEVFTQEAKKALTDAVGASLTKGTSSYSEMLETLKSKNLEAVLSGVSQLNAATSAELTELRKTIAQETVDSKKELEETLHLEQKKAHEEIEAQKEKELSDFRAKIVSARADILRELLATELTEEHQEKFVLQQLDLLFKKHELS